MSKNNPITISSWSLGDQWYTVNHKYPRIFLTAVSGGRFTHLLFLFCSFIVVLLSCCVVHS